MNNKARWTLVVLSVVLLLTIAITAILGQSREQEGIYKKLDIFVDVMRHIRNDYVEEVDTATIFAGALKGMTNTLDNESSYLSAGEYKRYNDEIGRRTAETGIEIIKHPNGYANVVFIRPDSPAVNSGVEVGDFIRAVDGESTRELSIMMIEFLLSGPPGEKATLSVLRSGVQQVMTMEVERKELEPAEISVTLMDGVGYIVVPSFRSGTAQRVNEACTGFDSSGVNSIIIDIRGNLKGDIEETMSTANLFVKKGKLLSFRSKDAEVKEFSADDNAFDFDLQILCDESTGRSAEAFAVALLDSKAATLVGRTTIGLGTVQRKVELDDGTLLNISYAKVVGPAGTEVNRSGVKPDVEVTKTSSDDKNVDKILNTALERAKQKDNSEKVASSVGA